MEKQKKANRSAVAAQDSLSGARVGTADLVTRGATRPTCPKAKRLPGTALGKPCNQPHPPWHTIRTAQPAPLRTGHGQNGCDSQALPAAGHRTCPDPCTGPGPSRCWWKNKFCKPAPSACPGNPDTPAPAHATPTTGQTTASA